jgi:hypothetical protein
MATRKTYPVPTWVRTVVCLAPFVTAGIVIVICLSTGRGFLLLGGSLTLCGAVAKHVLTKT